MQSSMPAAPIYKDLVLVGGGHAHIQALKTLAMNPIGNTRITLISDVLYAPYSGMLPGYLAGHYTFEEVHFDLPRLCSKANARFIHSKVIGVDTNQQTIKLDRSSSITFDILSINIGCSPRLPEQIDLQHTLPMKPISTFLTKWQSLTAYLDACEVQNNKTPKIAVVGGGAAGIEVAMILQKKLGTNFSSSIDLFQAASSVLPSHPQKTQDKLTRRARDMGINLYLNEKVQSFQNGVLITLNGKKIACDKAIWASQASAPSWLANTGLPTDEQGFIKVTPELQVAGHPKIFAAGDCIAFPTPLEKAGVHAVRQGKILTYNLRASLAGDKLKRHEPQKNFLSLITAGEKIAYASRGIYLGSGHLWWRIKDHIDRAFMHKWQDYSSMKPNEQNKHLPSADHSFVENSCGGCGSKVDPKTLSDVLTTLETTGQSDSSMVAIGLNRREDAVVTRPLKGQQITESVDMFRSFISDPYLFGKIATLHALSDLYAIGSKPFSAQALIQLQDAPQNILSRELQAILEGIKYTLYRENVELTGGHTTVGPELQAGFAVMGVLTSKTPGRKDTCREGDALILTKPLGTGACLRAHMHGDLSARHLEEVITGMEQSNAIALSLMNEFEVHAITDITGFGLAGHLLEMLTTPNLQARISLPLVPIYSGYHSSIAKGHMGTLAPAINAHLGNAIPDILVDPQTSGGLLLAVPDSSVQSILDRIESSTPCKAYKIGVLRARGPSEDPIVIEASS